MSLKPSWQCAATAPRVYLLVWSLPTRSSSMFGTDLETFNVGKLARLIVVYFKGIPLQKAMCSETLLHDRRNWIQALRVAGCIE